MKNIHILPTDKPSRLWMTKLGNLTRCHDIKPIKEALGNNVNIYITNDEEIKEGDWFLQTTYEGIFKCSDAKIEYIYFGIDNYELIAYCKKIILTTDQDLIKDGVQSIDDEFLEWFVKNPSCEWVKTQLNLPWESSKDEYEIIIPKEERSDSEEKFKQENTIEEAAEGYSKQFNYAEDSDAYSDFIQGAKWHQERSYSEEEVLALLRKSHFVEQNIEEWFEQFKKK